MFIYILLRFFHEINRRFLNKNSPLVNKINKKEGKEMQGLFPLFLHNCFSPQGKEGGRQNPLIPFYGPWENRIFVFLAFMDEFGLNNSEKRSKASGVSYSIQFMLRPSRRIYSQTDRQGEVRNKIELSD